MKCESDRESHRLTDKEFFVKIQEIENPKFDLDYTHTFKKSVKASYKSNKDLGQLLIVVEILVKTGSLPSEYNLHPLTGFPQKKDEKVMECHIASDWLLVWIQNNNVLTLLLFNVGSHSDLFYSKRLRKGI
jgi:mRNA interferase YafQ